LGHGEAVLAAFLHPGHRFRKTGKQARHVFVEGLGAPVIFAAVNDRPVIHRQDVVEQGSVGATDRLAVAALDRSELKAGRRDFWPQRSGADPGKADSGCNHDQEGEPQLHRPAGVGGTMGGFGDGHFWAAKS